MVDTFVGQQPDALPFAGINLPTLMASRTKRGLIFVEFDVKANLLSFTRHFQL